MVVQFRNPMSAPRPAYEETAWSTEIAAVEAAVDELLAAKLAVLRDDPQREQVLWARHVERLRACKRKLDAICV